LISESQEFVFFKPNKKKEFVDFNKIFLFLTFLTSISTSISASHMFI